MERWNRTLVYAQQGIFNAEDVPPGESVDFLEKDILGECIQQLKKVGFLQV